MLIASFSLLLSSTPFVATAPIERVTVLADRAEVTRTAKAKCDEGRARVAFPPLPLSLDPRTLRAEGEGGARVLGLVSKTAPVTPELDLRRKEVADALQLTQDRIAKLEDEIEVARGRSRSTAGFVELVRQVLAEEIRGTRTQPAQWRKSLEALAGEDISSRKKVVALGAELRKLQRERDRLARKLSVFDGHPAGEGVFVEVEVECGGSENFTLGLSYVVPGATWHPEYDLRFFADQGRKIGPGTVRLDVSAIVQQATGEDWSEATMVLSTAKPKLGGEAPYPLPLYLAGYEASSEKTLVPGQERRESLQAGGPSGQSGPRSAALEDGGRVVSFKLPKRVTVRSDGRPYWVPVDSVTGRGESKLVTIPKLAPHVYQVLSTTNFASYPLLSGRAHAHRSGSYVGDAQLNHLGPGEPIEISIGLDEEIAVERVDLKEIDRSPGFLSKTKKLERQYRVKLKNGARSAVRVEVRESIPVSKDEAIRVEMDEGKTTRGFRFDAVRGFVTWQIELPKNGDHTVDLAYVVKLPDDWKIQ